MKLSAVIGSLTAVGSVPATPTPLPTGLKPFVIKSLRSASPIHFGRVSASRGNFFINSSIMDAVCEVTDKTPSSATFYIKDSVLFLYTSKGPVQKVFVDRSGMGQGKMGYLTGDGPLPPRFEDKGWRIDKTGNLSFNGKGFLGCRFDKSWIIWVETNNPAPGGSKGCLGFSARTIPSDKPVSCRYS